MERNNEGAEPMINEMVRKHHQQIRRAIQELQEDVYQEQEVVNNQLWIALRIGTLTGILNVHLKYEDEQLYPYLLQHPREEVRAISKVFKKEMGDLSLIFESYKDKYLKKPDELVKNSSQFIIDTNSILYEISKRVEKEEHELFPLLD
ncbi:MAG: hypothetical protein APF84_04900 [Gracilibacter sp. BRH_c7a]|nr:MAG: hypothetical protein APF84_04900 [Gracilibacter sp. BRH_c7a]